MAAGGRRAPPGDRWVRRREPRPDDQPADAETAARRRGAVTGQLTAVRCRARAACRRRWEGARRDEDGERHAEPEPDAEPAEIAAQAGRAECAAVGSGREIDGRRQEGQERGDEDGTGASSRTGAGSRSRCRTACRSEPRRPRRASRGGTARRARARRDARRSGPQACLLRRSWPARARRDRDGGNAARDERRLLVEAEGEGEVDELRERAGARRLEPGLGANGGVGGGHERRARDSRRVAAELDPSVPGAWDADEVDDGREAVGVRRSASAGNVRRPTLRGASVRGDEDERVRERRVAQVARQLEERARSRAVVDGPGRSAQVVSVRNDRDRLLRLDTLVAGALGDGDDVDELLRADRGCPP